MHVGERTRKGPGARREWLVLAGLGLGGAALFFWRLGAPGLMDPDEGRYAEIAREIWLLKDWLIPHLNLVPYLEKPPLVYWLTALSFGALGQTELAARLPSALSALAGVFLAYGLGRVLWGPAAAWAGALVLATSAGYLALGRLLTLDMAFTCFLSLGLGLGYLALSRERPRVWPWAYGALALAVLVKGPAALVLAGLIWGVWSLIAPRPLRPLVQPRSCLLLLILVLPWFLWVQARYPEFFRFFILKQHLGRFLAVGMHTRPLYYYLPLLPALMLPWCWLLPWALLRKGTRGDPDRLFLLLWAGVVLAFFSLSRGKLPPYILPALPPLALLLGEALAGMDLAEGGWREWGGLRASLLAWALAGWLVLGLYWWDPAFLAPALAQASLFEPFLPWGLAALALTPTAALVWRRPALLLAGALLLSTLAPLAMERLSLVRSPKPAGLTAASFWTPGALLVGINAYSPGLSFYCRQPFHLVDYQGELDLGRSLSPENRGLFLAWGELAPLARSRPRVLFFLNAVDYPDVRRTLPGDYYILTSYWHCFLVFYEGK
jgi:4-amino-4-deoxy-L-arabinose transferase-like glycosyltransferase